MMFIDSLKMNSYYDLVGVAMKNTPAWYGHQTGENTIASFWAPAIYLPHIEIQ